MQIRGQRITFFSFLLAFFASTGGFIFGYDTGQISGIVIMDDFLRRFATCTDSSDASTCTLDPWRNGTITALLSVGTFFGALMGAPIADALGRRKAMTSECIIFIIGVIIQVTAMRVWQQIAVGRLIAGIGVGALSAAVPLYQAETAPKAIRGTLTATYQLMITLGILVAAAINAGTNSLSGSGEWRITIAIGILWAIILGVGILFMPESPRWLESQGKTEEAKAAIAKLHGVRDINDDPRAVNVHHEIKSFVESERLRSKARWIDCFLPQDKLLYRTLLGMTLQMLQQLTGANYFFYFGAQIFLGVGISNSFVTQIILNAVNVVCTFLGLYVMERFGRRWPLIIGGLWQSAWLFIFAGVGISKDPQTDKTTATVMIVSACLFILGYASTWAPGIWILIGESFPTRTRAKQGALSTSSNWLWNFLLAFFTQPITANIGYKYGFVFAACNLAGAVVVFFFLYESSRLSLEAVDMMYNDPAVKPWTSNRWVPPGYASRSEEVETSTKPYEGRLEKTNGVPVPSHTE